MMKKWFKILFRCSWKKKKET